MANPKFTEFQRKFKKAERAGPIAKAIQDNQGDEREVRTQARKLERIIGSSAVKNFTGINDIANASHHKLAIKLPSLGKSFFKMADNYATSNAQEVFKGYIDDEGMDDAANFLIRLNGQVDSTAGNFGEYINLSQKFEEENKPFEDPNNPNFRMARKRLKKNIKRNLMNGNHGEEARTYGKVLLDEIEDDNFAKGLYHVDFLEPVIDNLKDLHSDNGQPSAQEYYGAMLPNMGTRGRSMAYSNMGST